VSDAERDEHAADATTTTASASISDRYEPADTDRKSVV